MFKDTYKFLKHYIEYDINKENTCKNCIMYDYEFFPTWRKIKIEIPGRNKKEIYFSLMAFFVNNNIMILSTHPATYETFIKIDLSKDEMI